MSKVKELDKIGVVGAYHIRVIKIADKIIGVDIRKYIQTPAYSGYTKQGIFIPIKNVNEFHKLWNEAKEKVEELNKNEK